MLASITEDLADNAHEKAFGAIVFIGYHDSNPKKYNVKVHTLGVSIAQGSAWMRDIVTRWEKEINE